MGDARKYPEIRAARSFPIYAMLWLPKKISADYGLAPPCAASVRSCVAARCFLLLNILYLEPRLRESRTGLPGRGSNIQRLETAADDEASVEEVKESPRIEEIELSWYT
eukprot:scaffold12806_cov104-Isochrysis_galbana.AAC.11